MNQTWQTSQRLHRLRIPRLRFHPLQPFRASRRHPWRPVCPPRLIQMKMRHRLALIKIRWAKKFGGSVLASLKSSSSGKAGDGQKIAANATAAAARLVILQVTSRARATRPMTLRAWLRFRQRQIWQAAHQYRQACQPWLLWLLLRLVTPFARRVFVGRAVRWFAASGK